MAPTKNLRKNNRVKSKKRPIPKNNKRKTNKSKKRTSRNKRRTRRKQKGGMNTRVIVGKKNPGGRFRTGSRKSEIKRKLPTTASPSIQKREGRYIDPFEEYPQNLLRVVELLPIVSSPSSWQVVWMESVSNFAT